MTDPVNFAQISVTELENGSIQYDIIPHDQTEERAIVLLDQDGMLSLRDEDGKYMPIAGTGNINLIEGTLPIVDLPDFFVDQNVQVFKDPDNGAKIELSRNDDGAMVVDVVIGVDHRSQLLSVTPAENIGSDIRTMEADGKIGIGSASISPDGALPSEIPPSLKL